MTDDQQSQTNGGGALNDEQQSSIAALAAENTYVKQSKWKTLRELPAADKWPFFVQHFLVGTIAVVVTIAFVVSLAVTWLTRPPQTELSVAGIGMGEYSAQLDELKTGFVKAEKIDDDRLIDIDGSFTIAMPGGSGTASPTGSSNGSTNSYTDDSAKLMTMVSAGDVNMIVADKATFAELVHRGLIGKVSDVEKGDAALGKLAAAGALVDKKGEPIAGTSSSDDAAAAGKAYGLALSKSATWSGAGVAGGKGLPDDAVIGFANVVDATHASRARDFVTYLRFE
ncbi:hypothetical protein EMB92_09420 [Bifidobacterium callitrichos]|uniref:Uncharacterized protein n=1 Tax=Bifidobacterium callitrichos TaxID=762209 RepID=A0A5M9ZA55_9BIFI|nr:hypothetical protein [Bifidobacterium callitrichos]KAA8815398.1 hypothetical protein EMB92_09420 [Bifidobacterium callitrichos]